ncbi:MAG: YdeI/OmpD-associated family protein [Saprospiraceae bacterium]
MQKTKGLTLEKTVLKFGSKGEKTGWTYIEISQDESSLLNPSVKVSFRVKGKINDTEIKGLALLPMGDKSFILPLKLDLRKRLKIKEGDTLKIQLQVDLEEYQPDTDLVEALTYDPKASSFFYGLTKSHQNYYSKWIQTAKRQETKALRIADCIEGFQRKLSFPKFIHWRRETKEK